MKRVALLCLGLALGAAQAAEAQLTMQMSNGWSFTFAGNVNAFAVYDDVSEGGIAVIPRGAFPAGMPSRTSVSIPILLPSPGAPVQASDAWVPG